MKINIFDFTSKAITLDSFFRKKIIIATDFIFLRIFHYCTSYSRHKQQTKFWFSYLRVCASVCARWVCICQADVCPAIIANFDTVHCGPRWVRAALFTLSSYSSFLLHSLFLQPLSCSASTVYFTLSSCWSPDYSKYQQGQIHKAQTKLNLNWRMILAL